MNWEQIIPFTFFISLEWLSLVLWIIIGDWYYSVFLFAFALSALGTLIKKKQNKEDEVE